MEKKREPGYYRVKFKGKWVIAQYVHPPYENVYWILNNMAFVDEDFDEIDISVINATPEDVIQSERDKLWEEYVNSGQLDKDIERWIKEHPDEFEDALDDDPESEIHIPTDSVIDAVALRLYPHHPDDTSSLVYDKYISYKAGMKDMRDFLLENGLL